MTEALTAAHSLPAELEPALALSNIFVSSSPLSGEYSRLEIELELPDRLTRQADSIATSLSLLPDTIYCAAWLLLQRHWLGTSKLLLQECGRSDDGSTAVVRQPCKVDLLRISAEWLCSLDALRRKRANADCGTLASETVWLGLFNAATPVSVTTESALALGVRGKALVAFTSTALMDEAQAQSLLGSIVQTAASLLGGLDDPLGSVQTLDANQQRQLVEWNPPLFPAPCASSVQSVFAQQAAASADAVALSCKGASMTYAELDRQSTLIAARLQQAGVAAGDTVGVALERSMPSVVVLLAILKAGAAYLPLDVFYPPDRLAFMLADASAVLVVTTREHRATFAALLAVFEIDMPLDPHSTQPGFKPVAATGESLAYVMYTSGSTGSPKGIEICHRSILRLVIGAGYVDLNPRAAVMHAAPLGFDASTLEIWGPLLNGARCVVHDEVLPTGAGLSRTIRNEGVTTAWLTAALFNAVVDDDPQHLHGLRQLLIGGEALSVAHVRRALRSLPEVSLINGYGPTECTTFTATYRIPRNLAASARSVPIGRPITDTPVHVLSPTLQPMPIGLVGELFVGGHGLARAYLKRDALTAERFVPSPFGEPGERLYRTGDLVRYLPDGNIEFIGRADGQVKLRGFRIEVGEIEAALAGHAGVKGSAVVAAKDSAGNTRLVAYLVATTASAGLSSTALRAFLCERLPEFMVPACYVWMASFPLTANGKLDRRALPAPPSERPDLTEPFLQALDETERCVCAAFASALGFERIGRNDNFFDLGGNSLLVLRVLATLGRDWPTKLSTNTFFRQPTPAALARALHADGADVSLDARRLPRRPTSARRTDEEPIAIIAMAGRFPGARNVEQFWDNLCAGRDGITFFKDDELDPGLPPALTSDPCYVKARGVVDDVELFDAAFFGISPREAELMDPQQRIFLELCWECLERGGHAPDATGGPVGVFAGMYNATYFQRHVMHRPELIEKLGEFQVMLANEKDYIATRIANRLNLTGPAISVHTACSTSLVAIAQAFTSLRAGQCDMALAGGSSITCPPRSGYLYQDGAMLSPDGRTRSFDAHAQGTVFSDGATVVLLKRLSDAIADGNTVYALIRGVAVNNDGRDKASFTAPSVDGQAAVVAAAHASAGIDPRSISYVETHGTATPLGDPVELEGLTRAFRRGTADTGFCRIGSLKSNVGHMVIAAGAGGVIKTALSLATEQLPPSIHFEQNNPKIDFTASPFIVNDQLTPWPRAAQARRAGVSSFGVGGTNAHAVMEEGPLVAASAPARGPQCLQLSARSAAAVERMATQLAEHLEARPELNLADVAHTLQHGRSRFQHRVSVVAGSSEDAVAALRNTEAPMRSARSVGASVPSVVWLFPGQGSQYAGMGRGLYEHDAAFRAAFDDCITALRPVLPFDLAARMFDAAADALVATDTTQPATFCIEYALARAWLARGAQPVALIGHSVGEFAAAVIAGVMPLADAARLVAKRGALMQALPGGSMLSVRLALDKLLPLIPDGLSLAAENGPLSGVVAGPTPLVQAWQAKLEADGITTRLLQTSHAFHSSMMEAAVAPFEAEVQKVKLSKPAIHIVSTLTGTWMSDQDATDPRYWARHLREPVRFSTALRTAHSDLDAVFVEIGPRATLATLARQHAVSGKGAPVAIASLGDASDSESALLLLAQAQLWALGIELAAPAATPAEGRRRVLLPTYAFERKRFWIEAPRASATVAEAANPSLAAVAATPVEATRDATRDTTLTTDLPAPRPDMSHAQPALNPTPTAAARHPRFVLRLRELFEDVAGVDLDDADAAAPFVELGLDSLTLTQAALQVKKNFSVAITFRQLMEKYRSFDTLAKFLDESLPAEAAQAVASVAAAAAPFSAAPLAFAPLAMPATGQAAAPTSLVQQVIAQQMQLMAQQLALLNGSAGAVLAAPPATAVAEPAAPLATAAPQSPSTATANTAPAEEASTSRYDVKKAFGAIARIHTQAGQVTTRQRVRLETFMRRYVERTRRSKDYTVRHRSRLADPRVVNGFRPMTKEITYQIVIERSKGSRVWDIDGNEYVDVLNGFGMNLFGWQPDFVQDAVKKQLDAGYEIGPQHPLAGEVADLICELTGFDRAGLCNTGSEAVMAAVRIARTVTGRNTVVTFTGSYHGTFDEVLVRAGRGGKGIPAAPGIMSGVFGDVRVLDYGTPEALEFIRTHADDLAAVLVEPVQSRRPDFRPVEFLKEVRAITEKSGTCLIFDEVITGFRAHLGGTQALFGVRADLACYGKVIGGGFPFGVVAGKRDYMDALDGGAWQFGDDSMPTVGVTYFAGTFVRHPLALAAAKASLEHLKQQGPQLQERLNERTLALADELSAFCREVGAPLEIRSFASLWRVSWLEDHPLQDLLFATMRSRGVHILDNFPCFFTTAHSEADVQLIATAFKDSVRELQESDFLPRRKLPLAVVFDAAKPPVPGARLGKDVDGKPAWFVSNPKDPAKYLKVTA